MISDLARNLTLLRRERGISQKAAAEQLGVSQALLSHYENGVRRPGLEFVVKLCDFYNVSADFILGRTLSREGSMLTGEDILNMAEPNNVLRGSVLATLQSKLLGGAVGVLFGLLGRLGDKAAVNGYLVPLDRDDHIPYAEILFFLRALLAPPQDSPDPGQEFQDAEGFDHIVVRTGIQPLDPVELAALGGQDDDGDVARELVGAETV